MYQDFLDILSTAKNGLLDPLGGSLWNSTRTGHILPMLDSFATSIVSEHCPTMLKNVETANSENNYKIILSEAANSQKRALLKTIVGIIVGIVII